MIIVFKTRITEILNIEYPILLAPMGLISKPPLVAAVSNAGGLGILSAAFLNADTIRKQIEETRKLTDKPFGVNIPLAISSVNRILKVLLEEEIKIIFTAAGSPSKVLPKLEGREITTMHLVPSSRIAKKVEAMGVDILVAQGSEAGGIILKDGPTTMVLIPQVVEAVSVPVISAGGIATGSGFVAARALGAEGVLMGTRFLCSQESPVSIPYKDAIIDSKDDDTIPISMGKINSRVWKNKVVIESGGVMDPAKASLMSRPDGANNPDESLFVMGMSSGMVKEILSVKQIMQKVISEAHNSLQTLT